MEIRKIDELTERRELKEGQKVELLRDFYDTADFNEDRKPVHRMGDVGKIECFGEIYGQEVVTIEICHHGQGTFEVVPLHPSDVKIAPHETPLTEPDQTPDDPDEPLEGQDGDQPVILLDIQKTD
jgi:hypothetical protein